MALEQRIVAGGTFCTLWCCKCQIFLCPSNSHVRATLQFNVVRRSRWTEPSGASLGKCFFLASFADILDHSSCPGSLDNVRYHVYRPLSGFLHEKVLPHTLRQFSIDQWQRSRRGSIYGVVHVYRVQTSPSFTCAAPHLMDLLLREARAIIIEDCT